MWNAARSVAGVLWRCRGKVSVGNFRPGSRGGMRKILIVGIGAGNPDHMTVEAIEALNRADVLFIPDKGAEKAALAELRRRICERFIRNQSYRTVTVAGAAARRRRLGLSRQRRRLACADRRELRTSFRRGTDGRSSAAPCSSGATRRSMTARCGSSRASRRRLSARLGGHPRHQQRAGAGGTSSHRPQPHRRAGPGHHRAQTRGGLSGRSGQRRRHARRRADLPAGRAEDLDIYWGAYLGTPDEILVSGRLAEVGDEIAQVRREARERHGWIMDTYLLRRREPG